MIVSPDYDNARQEAGFSWHISGSQGALMELSGVPIREFNLDPESCIEAYRHGRPRLREMFGEDVPLPGLCTPAVSYGHANALGAELTFPEDGEVGHTSVYQSLQEGIAALQEPVDFSGKGMVPFYLEFRRRLQEAFPGEAVGWGFKHEGPLTTAWALRGHGFFTDIYDQPQQAKEFLRLVTDSIIHYRHFTCRIYGLPEVAPSGGLADDIAAMIAPGLWDEFVLPYWEQYYRGITDGSRHVHVEDLREEHLKFLEQAGIAHYDPSISPKLNPAVITAGCRVPFSWRLGCIDYHAMDETAVANFVYRAVADGASNVFTVITSILCREPNIGKVQAFIAAAKDANDRLRQGIGRQEIGGLASTA